MTGRDVPKDKPMAKYITSIERIGRVEGKREAIQYLLTRRFGPLPSAAAERVAQADREQLELWLDRLLDARTLDDLLDPDSLDYGGAGYTTSVERLAFNIGCYGKDFRKNF